MDIHLLARFYSKIAFYPELHTGKDHFFHNPQDIVTLYVDYEYPQRLFTYSCAASIFALSEVYP